MLAQRVSAGLGREKGASPGGATLSSWEHVTTNLKVLPSMSARRHFYPGYRYSSQNLGPSRPSNWQPLRISSVITRHEFSSLQAARFPGATCLHCRSSSSARSCPIERLQALPCRCSSRCSSPRPVATKSARHPWSTQIPRSSAPHEYPSWHAAPLRCFNSCTPPRAST